MAAEVLDRVIAGIGGTDGTHREDSGRGGVTVDGPTRHHELLQVPVENHQFQALIRTGHFLDHQVLVSGDTATDPDTKLRILYVRRLEILGKR